MAEDDTSPAAGRSAPERPHTWMDALEEMLDETVDREDQLELVAEDLRVEVPLRMGRDAPRAEWGFDGTVRVDVDGVRGPLAEWLRISEERSDRDD